MIARSTNSARKDAGHVHPILNESLRNEAYAFGNAMTSVAATFIFVYILTIPGISMAQQLKYPNTYRDTIVNDYFGTKVPAPYQWMEDQNSPKVEKWVEAENKVTFAYLDRIPYRTRIQNRITKLWNYPKVGVPSEHDGILFYSKNTGLQNQSPIFMEKMVKGRARLVLDPNKLSPNGSIAFFGI